MNNIDTHAVVKKLIGPITPEGCSATDAIRFDNLMETVYLVERLVTDILIVSENKNNYQASMKKIGERAQRCLDDIKKMIH